MLTLSLLVFNLSAAAHYRAAATSVAALAVADGHPRPEQQQRGAAELFLFGTGAALFGAGYGGFIALQHTTVMSVFGMEAYGRAMGTIQGIVILPGVFGPVLMGGVRDATGNYTLAFWLVAGLFVVAGVLLTAVDRMMTRRTGAK